jgi:hypothetical protein
MIVYKSFLGTFVGAKAFTYHIDNTPRTVVPTPTSATQSFRKFLRQTPIAYGQDPKNDVDA